MGAFGRSHLRDRTSAPHPSEIIGATPNLRVSLISDKAGLVEFGGSPHVVISMHVGPSVSVDCTRGGERHRGIAIHGDLEIIPPHLGGIWEIKSQDTALVIGLRLHVLRRVVEESGGDSSKLQVKNRFQARDAQMEHIGWALKAEMESGYPSGRLYMDSLALALAARVVRNHSSMSRSPSPVKNAMLGRKFKAVLAYIEDHLEHDLALDEIAEIAGVSASHFKVLFRQTLGMPPHQYVIRRRVERAATQLREGKMTIGEIAFANGFCHQSHLAMHVRRVLGVSPQEVRESC